ncbi:hypothetical protein M0R45_025558 [Rubus argutus]|uniref:Vesicle-fusing ATPase n=1 Tax=Rubus argutus TaxID=59490 RepID=A0AAW1WVU1_RUBAR
MEEIRFGICLVLKEDQYLDSTVCFGVRGLGFCFGFTGKIDGVQSLNNILLIGMTNRKDLIDEPLLRTSGSLPHENGRLQILQIHTNKMKESSFLAPDVNLQELAARTKNYSCAELEGVVKSAVSFALNRQLSSEDLTKPVDEEKSIKVTMDDFRCALPDIVPAFGACIDDLESIVKALIDATSSESKLEDEVGVRMVALLMFDHEEVRLDSAQGAGSPAMLKCSFGELQVPLPHLLKAACESNTEKLITWINMKTIITPSCMGDLIVIKHNENQLH